MKTIILKSLLVIACLLSSANLSAYSYYYKGGLYFHILSETELTCEIVQGDIKYLGDIVIPPVITWTNKRYTVVKIRERTFFGCKDLKSVTIPNSVTEIESLAFWNCKNLTKVIISESVTKIARNNFNYCPALTTLYVLNPTPPAIIPAVFDLSEEKHQTIKVFVPRMALNAYKQVLGWNRFLNLQGFDPK